MSLALEEARKAFMLDEVPVGAVIVREGRVIGWGHNLRETMKNALAHAEIVAINEACRSLNGWRLIGCDIYVTLEPCIMCTGALVNARVERIIYGASEPKRGGCGSLYSIAEDERLNHRIEVVPGVMEKECREILQEFFRMKRGK